MSLPRFHFAPIDPVPGSTVILDGAEGRHAARVVRLRPGDRAVLFDGAGVAVTAEVVGLRGERLELRVLDQHTASRELAVAITIVPAVLKSDAMDALIRDATMLGAAAIAPVLSARTVVSASAATSSRTVDRWRRIALASAKQCGRTVLPVIVPARPFAAMLRDDAWAGCHRILLCEPAMAGEAEGPFVEAVSSPVILMTGPEGGWTEDEVARARDEGWRPWTCSPMTLRAETAAVAALAIAGWRAELAGR